MRSSRCILQLSCFSEVRRASEDVVGLYKIWTVTDNDRLVAFAGKTGAGRGVWSECDCDSATTHEFVVLAGQAILLKIA